ncbi:hypothetical protein PHYBLDRAFT_148951 [Phycomyces blakesleeanus NRRL 1555(-)]|uniref:Uncharacterized protein n=1 Tax=Phycomyces blakesleeanus (strain ATCC 8743b / DSM 1359 / FGSC 10004 / NBRC 33097 / NRRL 1555) TaxID=763407 RepID=A0A162ZY06_PHYB8|nr:hypothetical protein PHYBLDRAFT_148951 [Phycomyces blakesleeanus NRRL 1555(-)]OAD69761.1 hypothetical protein PHYBLDRAFT_148951 [Phycomyces blakesleeanus NRRL 1555(-)]|eukprot:XP_018287801.1 hypothetical protein PHYBLDRAFT_148951 [Phycomyces blakesleeanus NRRL 1555(-)]
MALPDGEIITKPFAYWKPEHQKPIQIIDYVECITFSLQTGVFCLLQCFWNYLSNSVAKKTFMGSNEFKLYIIWAIASMAVFPFLQWWYRNDVLKREAVPQLAYSCEVLILVILGIRSHFRFLRIIKISHKTQNANSPVVIKMTYFKDMNIILTISMLSYGGSLMILCADGLTEKMFLNTSKFASDLIIGNCNVSVIFIWIALISIFHPRSQFQQDRTIHSASEATQQNTKLSNLPVRHDQSTGFAVSSTGSGAYRLNERITSFMATKFQAEQTNGLVDENPGYAYTTQQNVFNSSSQQPLSPLSPPSRNNIVGRNKISVEDPYSNEDITFTMVDPSSRPVQLNSRFEDSAYENIEYQHPTEHSSSNPLFQPSNNSSGFSRIEPNSPLPPVPGQNSAKPSRFDPLSWEQTQASYDPNYPYLETPPIAVPSGGRDKSVGQDWLKQSPHRRTS